MGKRGMRINPFTQILQPPPLISHRLLFQIGKFIGCLWVILIRRNLVQSSFDVGLKRRQPIPVNCRHEMGMQPNPGAVFVGVEPEAINILVKAPHRKLLNEFLIEERAVIQATMEAGARRVYLIEEPLAAALGAKLDFSGPDGRMIVDIGGGTTDIAVLSLGGIAYSSSIKVAGDTFDDAVVSFMRRHYGMLIGLNTAEEVKITIGCVYDRPEETVMTVKGRDLKTGLPKEQIVSSVELIEAFKRPARQIVDEVLSVMEHSSPELVADIAQSGIVLSGGGSLLYGFDKLIAERTEIACRLVDETQALQLSQARATAVYRICQEALTNIARHAEASEVRLCLRQVDGHLQLEIEDNGRGLVSLTPTGKSIGLLSMAERAREFGGALASRARPGGGTCLLVNLPLEE